MIAQTNNLEKFIVCRDGLIDEDYYDQQYAERKREVLKQVSREAIRGVLQLPKTVGSNILSLLSEQLSQNSQ